MPRLGAIVVIQRGPRRSDAAVTAGSYTSGPFALAAVLRQLCIAAVRGPCSARDEFLLAATAQAQNKSEQYLPHCGGNGGRGTARRRAGGGGGKPDPKPPLIPAKAGTQVFSDPPPKPRVPLPQGREDGHRQSPA